MFESGRAGDQTHGRQDLPIYSPVTYPLDHRAFDKDAMFFQLYICNIHILIYYNVYTHIKWYYHHDQNVNTFLKFSCEGVQNS